MNVSCPWRQGEVYARPVARLPLCPHLAALSLDDALHCRETDTETSLVLGT